MELNELKEWLRVDGEDEDKTLSSLLLVSKSIIKLGTGLVQEDTVDDEAAAELYKLAQKIIITNFYEDRGAPGKENVGLTSLYMQLEAYKMSLKSVML
ncbi:head-tail connector protein [Clostridium tagluense]|uniref:head-tail connector protein n=1 Tax=Clostridium tagluense TaxID=360422 RepID=UPI001CF31AC1|nr:head-tail connector protein [Clostridium tagluense]MCB2310658.1 head-tail connector protein [Clostridium tagluense]MCB2315611.1 head-tail connector protein [Clostridium tagluense]MCB2320465.1 head-tail connector protein [Clostridium tagluense]MCB2325252.1 head-tail connector protein [Clostridium tagluense]MCB2330104.1 head-tail connector protein [Clostridium tagluense]